MTRSIILILTILTLSCLPALAKQSSIPALDEVALRENLASRLIQHPDITKLTGSDLYIEAQHAVQIGTNTFYAVKVALQDAHPNAATQLLPMTFVTDPTGTLLLNSAIDLRNGKEAVLSQSPNVTRIEFPASTTPSTFVTGTGEADVIFVADVFCPHCRKGYTFLSDHLGSIRRIRLAHNPLNPSNGSAIAAWVMEHALASNIQPWDVVRFSFSELKSVSPHNEKGTNLSSEQVSMNILAQYKGQFPQLFKAVNGDLEKAYEMLITKYAQNQIKAHSQLKKAGFNSSPIFIINGRTIKGMDKKNLTSALNGDRAISSKGKFCNDNTDGCAQ